MATILKGDCLKVMATLPDKSVDCFICDLPYGQLSAKTISVDRSYRGGGIEKTTASGCPWDIKIDINEFWKQVKRLCKDDHTPVLMFCNTKFGHELIKSNEAWFRYDLVWDKQRGVSFLLANKMPMKSHEMVYVFSKRGAFYRRVDMKANKIVHRHDGKHTGPLQESKQYGIQKVYGDAGLPTDERCPLSVITLPTSPARNGHPTEKPITLYEWLLRRYVPDNGVVLDPTAGSFNAIHAATNLGYKSIGIEMDTHFFWKGVQSLLSK